MSATRLLAAAEELSRGVGELDFRAIVPYVYNPLEYARQPHAAYLRQFGKGKKKVLFLGMNPGPWGMAQTGVPFGEIPSVRDWMGIKAPVATPARVHPDRPVTGFACPRSEVSGRRLWALMQARFGSAARFFRDHFVANYCPLVFMEASGRNYTPDKLPGICKKELFALCDRHLLAVITELQPRWLLGIGKFAEKRLLALKEKLPTSPRRDMEIGSIIHPSPANPQANRGWAEKVTARLVSLGVWEEEAGPES